MTTSQHSNAVASKPGLRQTFSREALETTYCFMHQKLRVYEYSTMEWQKDDIEYAIAQYIEQMPSALYTVLAEGKKDYLTDHQRFVEDMRQGVMVLEEALGI